MSKTVFIVDDESTVREVVRKYLERENFRVLEAATGVQALTILREHPVDLILLDIMLPELDGFSITRSIRQSSEYGHLIVEDNIPIIMLTSRSGETDRITGFELGVDDYVVKPFSPRELVARVKAVLRRSSPQENDLEHPLVVDDLVIDPVRHLVSVGEKPITLTVKEFDLLWLMARHPQQVFTREQLLDRIWGYDFYGGDSTVTVHIRRLREKLEPDPSEPAYIKTVWGVGYKFDPT